MSLKTNFINFLRSHPVLFDKAKRISRWLGSTDPLHEALCEFLGGKKDICFLQIGSNDGLGNDPLREFVLSGNWRGCLVEPLPHTFARLRDNYDYADLGDRLHFINAAVSSQQGEATIYNIAERYQTQLPFYARQIASFDRSHLLRHFPDVPDINEMIEAVQVPCLTPEQVIAKANLPRVDLMLLDVEGHEEPILRAFPFAKVRPAFLIFESAHLNTERMTSIVEYLGEFGYQCTTLGNDTVARQS